MNKALLQREVQGFIRNHLEDDLSKLILKGSPFNNISIQEIAIQINGLQKAKTKLPAWFHTEGIFFPPNINIEQTSSEVTAKYKASLILGKILIDLTGGLGIDSYYFSERFTQVYHLEINPELSQIASHNFKKLGRKNLKTITGDGIEFLKNSGGKFDWIYLDPGRRDDHGSKVFLLKHCTPNVNENLDLFFEKSDNILIKTSPLLDLSAGMKELKDLAEIHIVSHDNEVKELLWILKKGYSGKNFIHTVNFQKKGNQFFKGEYIPVQEHASLSVPGTYLYEPNPAVMKSGLFAELALQTRTSKLHVSSHLFTSDELVEFPGRRFKIQEVLPYSKKLKKHPTFKKANITTRNFPKQVSEIRKEMKIGDGGENYIFFTTNLTEEKIVLVCKKI